MPVLTTDRKSEIFYSQTNFLDDLSQNCEMKLMFNISSTQEMEHL
jgi:hypothetical protein